MNVLLGFILLFTTFLLFGLNFVGKSVMDVSELFKIGCDSVFPDVLVKKQLRVDVSNDPPKLLIENFAPISLKVGIHVAAFGKASLGMARAVQDIFGEKLIKKGFISAPVGSVEVLKSNGLGRLIPTCTQLVVCEGAADNYPDQSAAKTANDIENMATQLGRDDVLMVLASGGGSALLPAPIVGLTLNEKTDIIKALSKGGAKIDQLNTVRQHLSRLKGGKLAKIAQPATAIGLIFSDIIGNDLQFVASGPTVQCSTTAGDCIRLLQTFMSDSTLKTKAINLMKQKEDIPCDKSHLPGQILNILIGDSQTALDAIQHSIREHNDNCYIVSNCLEGEARERGEQMAILVHQLMTHGPKNGIEHSPLIAHQQVSRIGSLLVEIVEKHRPMYLLWGGETTVTVIKEGAGVGGRNQELALAYLIKLKQLMKNSDKDGCGVEATLLSGGTDGQDGPNDAAGAVISTDHVKQIDDAAMERGICALNRNDSYNFWAQFCNGECHLKPGLTGTNVMDIVIVKLNKI